MLTALTHRSYAHEKGVSSNETLEFLGDAVLQMAVTSHLFAHHSDLSEGQMTRVRAAVVRKEALTGVAEALGVGPALRLGKGESGWAKAGILADATEALIGAVYLDGGWKTAEKLVIRHWRSMIENRAAAPDARDAKTELQERLAADGKAPEYRMRGEGPGHARRFRVECRVAGKTVGVGEGTSRRLAEQQAAAEALKSLFPEEKVVFLNPVSEMPVAVDPDGSPSPGGRRLFGFRKRGPARKP